MLCTNPFTYKEQVFPCGKCLFCRVNVASMWQHRILLESTSHKENTFLTVTFDDDNLPDPPTLDKEEVKKYLKRLRRRVEPRMVRYFCAGEYGEINRRPHYHFAIFGLDPETDREVMEKAWNKGFVYTGRLEAKSARYISGYIVKGHNFKEAKVLNGLEPEFRLMSKNLGLRAVEGIGQELKNNPWKNIQPITRISYGKKKLPLGKYLTDKLIRFAELDKGGYESEKNGKIKALYDDRKKCSLHIKAFLEKKHGSKRFKIEHNQRLISKKRNVK